MRYNSTESSVVLAAVAIAGAVSLLPSLCFAGLPPGVDVLPVGDVAIRRLVFAAHRRGNPPRPSVALMLERLEAAARAKSGG